MTRPQSYAVAAVLMVLMSAARAVIQLPFLRAVLAVTSGFSGTPILARRSSSQS
jgi:hypothetical protein